MKQQEKINKIAHKTLPGIIEKKGIKKGCEFVFAGKTSAAIFFGILH